jgi:hypothetical protein
MRRPLVVLAILLISAVASVRADIITLMDGSQHEGEVIREDVNTITLQVRMGGMKGLVTINRLDIKELRVTDAVADPAIAEGETLTREAEKQTEIKKALEAWTKVADFYSRRSGFSSAMHSADEKILLLDPENEAARARQGYVRTPAGWALKSELQRAERARLEEKARAVLAAKAPEDETVIGLRQDNEKLKKILDEKNARAQAELQPVAPPQVAQQQVGGVPEGQVFPPPGTAVNTVIEEYRGLPYYPTILYGFGPNDGLYSGYGYGYGSGFGYGGGFYGNNYYNSGALSVGFRGKIGSVRFSGGINNGFGFGGFGFGHHRR